MTVEELKQEIAQRTGVPAALLNGETAEENIAQAKALLAYKRECDEQRPKTTAEKFSDWLNAQAGEDAPQAAPEAATTALEAATQATATAGGYPIVRDGGEASGLPDPRPAREQFAEWLQKKTAFDPFTDLDGWKRLQ